MKVAKILKATAIVEWALGFILGIVSGTNSIYGSFYYSSGFNFASAITLWIAFFISGIMTYGFGELLGHVVELRTRTDEQLYYLTDAVGRLSAAQAQRSPQNDNNYRG